MTSHILLHPFSSRLFFSSPNIYFYFHPSCPTFFVPFHSLFAQSTVNASRTPSSHSTPSGRGNGGDEEGGDDEEAELQGLALARASRSESDPITTPIGSLSPAFDASSNASPTLARTSKFSGDKRSYELVVELADHLRDLVSGETTVGGGGGGSGFAVSSGGSSSSLLVHGTPSLLSPHGPTTGAGGGRGSYGGSGSGSGSGTPIPKDLSTTPSSTAMGYCKARVMAEKSELLVSMLHHQLRDVAKRTAHPGRSQVDLRGIGITRLDTTKMTKLLRTLSECYLATAQESGLAPDLAPGLMLSIHSHHSRYYPETIANASETGASAVMRRLRRAIQLHLLTAMLVTLRGLAQAEIERMEGGGLSFPNVGGGPSPGTLTPTHPVDTGPGLPPPARGGGGVDEETCKLRLVIFRLALTTLQEEGKHGFDFLGDENGGN